MNPGSSVLALLDVEDLQLREVRDPQTGRLTSVELAEPAPARTAFSKDVLVHADRDWLMVDRNPERILVRHSGGVLVYAPIAWDSETVVAELVEQHPAIPRP